MSPLCCIQREETILGQLKWSTTGKISVPRALRCDGEQKSLSADFAWKGIKKNSQLLSPLKTVSAPLGLVRATLNLWIMYYLVQKCTLNLATAIHLVPVALKLALSPRVSQNAASRNQATGMEHCPTWGCLLTKLDHDFRAIAVPLATNGPPPSFAMSPVCTRLGKFSQTEWWMQTHVPRQGSIPFQEST